MPAPTDDYREQLRLLGQRSGDQPNTLAGVAPTPADAWDYNSQAAQDWLAYQRSLSDQRGLWNSQTGWPTQAGMADAGKQMANALVLGTTAPGARSAMLDNPAFTKWFGKSQMVDEAGNPTVAYHGTADSFGEFQHGHVNAKDTGWLGKGSYFWNEPKLAGDYALLKAGDAPNIMPVHLKLENPYRATMADKERLMLKSRRDPEASAKFTADLQEQGYDGVILDYPHKPGLQEVVVFSPKQIKSAVGNRGTFDPKDPRITYGVAGAATAAGAVEAAKGEQ